jgi:hypothetical protein
LVVVHGFIARPLWQCPPAVSLDMPLWHFLTKSRVKASIGHLRIDDATMTTPRW